MSVRSDWSAKVRKVLDCVLRRPAPQALSGRAANGQQAERLAEQHLIAHGARILARNARCKGGEIDLIAEHAGCIVFAEVRFRQHESFGGANTSITLAKQRRIVRAAQFWLQSSGSAYRTHPCRFDALLLTNLAAPQINWIQAAFDAEPR